MMKTFAIAMLVLVGCAHYSHDRFTYGNAAWEGTFVAATAYDWSKTAAAQYTCTADMPGLDTCGRPGHGFNPTTFFVSTMLFHAAVSYVLPQKYRHVFQPMTAGAMLLMDYRDSSAAVTGDWVQLRKDCTAHPMSPVCTPLR